MENNILKIIKESGSIGPKYDSLEKIFKLYEQLQYATNIKHTAHDIYYWLNREFRIDNMVFALFNINNSTFAHRKS